jgi:hypothetical protein
MAEYSFLLECKFCGHTFAYPKRGAIKAKSAHVALSREIISCPGVKGKPHLDVIWNGEQMNITDRFTLKEVNYD